MREIKYINCNDKFIEVSKVIEVLDKKRYVVDDLLVNLGEKAELTFNRCIMQLTRILMNHELKKNEYGDELETYTCEIYPDSYCKGSFYFVYKLTHQDGTVRQGMNGGIILHGYNNEETFSVEVAPEDGPHWSIHT